VVFFVRPVTITVTAKFTSRNEMLVSIHMGMASVILFAKAVAVVVESIIGFTEATLPIIN
jgi:hypothetical protein